MIDLLIKFEMYRSNTVVISANGANDNYTNDQKNMVAVAHMYFCQISHKLNGILKKNRCLEAPLTLANGSQSFTVNRVLFCFILLV